MDLEKRKRYTIDPRAKDDGEAIVFVHGLSGSPLSTWAKMSERFADDSDFTGVVIDYYAYPTRLVRLPFTPPLPGLKDLADGLRTFLEERHGTRKAISIVAHSLGGLIVRHMVVSATRAGSLRHIKNIALLAVPSTGATLANVGSLVSFPHRQLKALCRDEEGLTALNLDWEQLKVEESIQVRYIMGGCDRIVPADSAAPYIGQDNKSVIIDADHRSIVAPESSDDLRYKTIKRFLGNNHLAAKGQTVGPAPKLFERPLDPLFDVYTPTNELYYLSRPFDKILADVMARGHVWLTGESGIGKSASARRAVYSGGWHLHHISLSGHSVANAQDLFGALCAELSSLTAHPENGIKGGSFNDQIAFVKRALVTLRSDKVMANVVEEMPISSDRLSDSAEIMSQFLEMIDTDDRLYGQIRFAFSSRHPIAEASTRLSSKVREKIQFLPIQTWSYIDIIRLVQLLVPAIKPDLSAAEQAQIASSSGGSPRFVKMAFRHWRNHTSNGASVEELCSRVKKELVL